MTPFWSYSHYIDGVERAGGGEFFRVADFGGSGEVGAVNGKGAEVVPLRFNFISNFLNGAAVGFISGDPDAPPRVALLRETPESGLPEAGRLIKVEINGRRLLLPDTDPVIENGRTLAPMYYIFEALGAEVTWDPEARTVTGVKDGTEVQLTIDKPAALVNGAEVALDAPPVLRGGRTLVPIRFIAESLGAEVVWNPGRRAVVIGAAE
jgi:hypothetical protein